MDLRGVYMNRKHAFVLAMCVLLLSTLLFCLSGYAEIQWSTEQPDGRYLTRTQYSHRMKSDDGLWFDWSEWS